MENRNYKKLISFILTLTVAIGLFTGVFTVKANAYTSNSEIVEEQLKSIVARYGEENVLFEDGIYLEYGESIDLSDSEEYQGILWTSEDNEILEVNGNVVKGIDYGTTFLVGSKENKYYLKQVYVHESEENQARAIRSVESRSQYVAYVDAGHGGYDSGAVANGLKEKDLTLNIALKVKAKLEAKGIKVVMSRDNDKFLSLQDIANKANASNPDMFISIHINSAGATTSASGIETYYYKGMDQPLASDIQNKLIEYTGAKNRGVKWEEFFVVKNTNMPASLIECGFITNVTEANKLNSTSYQDTLASAIVDGATSYLFNQNPLVANRLYGSTRYETSYEVFKMGWSSSETVVLASGLDYPDALCATPLASKYDAPILLAKNTSLNNQADLTSLLKSRGVKNVFIVGGTGVLPSSFEGELASMGISSKRLGGINRYETSVKVAQELGSNTGEMALVSGLDFADGLSMSSIAGKRNMPILLSGNNYIPQEVANYIAGAGINKTYVIGGTGAISNNISNMLPNVERLGGKNRYETSKQIFNRFRNELNLSNFYIASGLDFPDALASSALASKQNSFVVLSNVNYAEQEVKDVVSSSRGSIQNLYVLGGNTIVTDNALYNLGVRLIR